MGSYVVGVESSSSSPNFNYNHDVFLSFRGEDTRHNFISHLHMALRLKEVNVFIDNILERGEQISVSLLKSIKASRISIVVFSENYASSSWCLDELVKIIKCMNKRGQVVLPVFYKVDPTDVRNQTGKYAEALAKHEANKLRSNKIQPWKKALTTAANLSGWDLKHGKDEAELIQVEIVKRVLSVVNPTRLLLNVAKHPVGVDYRLKEIEELVSRVGYNGVNMVGMYGIGGIGKTTLAKALYNNIANQFEGCYFLQDVREKLASKYDLAQLQEMLLNGILKDFYPLKVVNHDEGINVIKSRFCSKKVLIVLDDVDSLEQLEALVGGRDWFGQGSKIIVTTRNKRLLTSHGFDEKEEIQKLNQDHALELFSWYAFKDSLPPTSYLDLSKRATNYCEGLSLALVVLGSFLSKTNQAEWNSILDGFENSLKSNIKNILQLSFDGLEDRVKHIFLDISCFFVGEEVNCAKKMLKVCHPNLDFGIIVLMDFSLVTVENDKVKMHGLIQQMGHDIVYSESPNQLGKRSRLWLWRDVLEVFTNNSGTDAIKAIKLEYPNPTKLNVDPQAFRNMTNLKLLIFRNVRFSTKLKYLPHTLKWIEWHQFFQPSLPSHFDMKNLVGLDLQHSFIKKFGGLKVGEWLKYINLSNSTLLKKVSDLSAISNLEELYLKNCPNLRTIDKSIFSNLVKLTTLNLHGCSNLKKLPTSRFMLRSLIRLNLSYCKKLEKISNFSSALDLKYLYLKGCTNLRSIDKSVFCLDKLVILDLHGCCSLNNLPTTRFMLTSLNRLDLSYCKKLEQIPDLSSALRLRGLFLVECTNLRMIHESIGCLDRLGALDLRRCINLLNFPTHLSLKDLYYLNLSWCCKLQSFPTIDENMKFLRFMDLSFSAIKDLPSSIQHLTNLCGLNLSNCTSLNSLPDSIYLLKSLMNLELRNCKSLRKIPNLPQNIQTFDANGCESLSRNPDNIVDIISKKQDVTLGEISREFIVMNTGIPKWFSYKTRTNLISASFRHYPDIERTLAACVHFKVNGDSSKRGTLISCTIFICNKLHSSFSRRFLPSKSEYLWLVTTSLAWGSIDQVEYWNNVLVWFEIVEADFEVNVSIKSYGVHVTEDLLHGKQTDLNWPLVNYADFYQWEKLQNDLNVDDVLVKSYFQEMSCISNSQAMLHAPSYDPETVIDSKIKPMIFPLHVTYNGDTVICGMEGMGDTAIANSLCNKFNWSYDNIDDYGIDLDNSTSFYFLQGRTTCSLHYREPIEHGIFSKSYYIAFQNLDAIEYRHLNAWVKKEPRNWYRFDHPIYERGRKCHFIIRRLVDPSLCHPPVGLNI